MGNNHWDISENALDRVEGQLAERLPEDQRPWAHGFSDLDWLAEQRLQLVPAGKHDPESPPPASQPSTDTCGVDTSDNLPEPGPFEAERVEPSHGRGIDDEIAQLLDWLELEDFPHDLELGERTDHRQAKTQGQSPSLNLDVPLQNQGTNHDAAPEETGIGPSPEDTDEQKTQLTIGHGISDDFEASQTELFEELYKSDLEGLGGEEEGPKSEAEAPELSESHTENPSDFQFLGTEASSTEEQAGEPEDVPHLIGVAEVGPEADVDASPPAQERTAKPPSEEGRALDVLLAELERGADQHENQIGLQEKPPSGTLVEQVKTDSPERIPEEPSGRAGESFLPEEEGERTRGSTPEEPSVERPSENTSPAAEEEVQDPQESIEDVEPPNEIGLEEIAQRFQAAWADEEAEEAEGGTVEIAIEKRLRTPTLLHRLGFKDVDRRLGIEVGSSEVTFVSLAKKGRRYEVDAYGIVPFREIGRSGEAPEALATALQEILAEKVFRQADLIATSQLMDQFVRMLEIPKLSKKELAKAVRWSLRKEVPFHIEEASIVFRVHEAPQAKKQGVLAVATESKHVVEFAETLQRVGARLSGVYPGSIALLDLFKRSNLFNPDSCQVLVYLGTLNSQILFVNKGTLAFERTIPTALDDFLNALANSLFLDGQSMSLSQREAFWILRHYGVSEFGSGETTDEGLPLNEIAVSVRPVLEKLASELSRSLDYFRDKFGVEHFDHVWLCGIGATLLNLCKMLESETQVPTSKFDPFSPEAGLPIESSLPKLEEYGPSLVVPLGLALIPSKEFNLLPRKLRRTRSIQWAQKAAAYGALFGLIGMGLLSIQTSLSEKIENNELAVLRDRYEVLQRHQQQLAALRQQRNRLTQTLSLLQQSLPSEPLVPLYLHALSKLTPRKIALTSVEIVNREDAVKELHEEISDQASALLRLRGIVFRDPPREGIHLANFLLALKTSGLFLNVRVVENRPSDVPRVGAEFVIVGEIP